MQSMDHPDTIWTSCLEDQLIIARVLVAAQMAVTVGRLHRRGLMKMEREDVDGFTSSYVFSFTEPTDAAMALMVIGQQWGLDGILIEEDCFHCGAKIETAEDVESSLGSDLNQCSRCRAQYDDDGVDEVDEQKAEIDGCDTREEADALGRAMYGDRYDLEQMDNGRWIVVCR